ncbi:MAG: AtpZ/AtpI family protein [Bacteroidota bacterium]
MENRNKPNNPKPADEKRPPLESYARYSSLAFQMFAIIGLGVFGGVKLDQWLKIGFPVFTVVLSLLSVAAAIYTAVKDLLRKK